MPIELGSFSIGATAGAAVGALIGHYLTKSRDKETRKFKSFNEAAQTFRDAFTAELVACQSTNKEERLQVYNILLDAFSRQEAAIIAFKQYLDCTEVPRFETAWIDYCYPEGSPEEAPGPFCDYISDCNEKLEKENRKQAIKKINELLAFAKLK